MNTSSFVRRSVRLLARVTLPLALCAATVAGAQNADLADKPLFSTTSVPGNLLLDLSVEYPTANTTAYFSTSAYVPANPYLGYFDAAKCYRYKFNSSTPSASYFEPNALATAGHLCSSSAPWSGNYLNYAAMQSLDIFRWVLTGGNRTIDTNSQTILQKATHSGQGGAGDAPNKTLAAADEPGATPVNFAGGLTTRIWGAGIRLLVTGTANLDGGIGGAVDYDPSATLSASTIYALYMNVQVCDTRISLESNCVQYGSNYKPEGLIQQYSSTLRYSAFGYLNDSAELRDGGVLRARMAFIGPTVPQPGTTPSTNTNAEWDASTGVMATNPDPADATDTNTFTGNKTAINQSGVMNYLNKFGYTSGTYKTYDPVSELYYASLRYLKGQTNVTAYTDVTTGSPSTATVQGWVDGFPVITDWTSAGNDPIIYSCQKNFILGIGDVNTNRDEDLPNSHFWPNGGHEPASQPAEVVADAAATPPVDVTASTDLLGTMEGTGALGQRLESGGYGTYYMAGLAYDAHIPVAGKGVRTYTDPAGGPDTYATVSTYWLDVLEYQAYVNNNLYYYATKYGGFTVPDNYAYGTAPTLPSWYTSTNTLGSNKQPDNYFTASDPTLMKNGLTSAFAKIAKENDTTNGTALSVPTPNVSSTGSMSYAATYDPKTWTGDVTGSSVTFAADGTPSLTPQWDARTLLTAASVTAANRKIVTCCTTSTTAPGLTFETTSLTGGLNARTYYASFANVPGVATTSQSSANYVAYLRGDITQEIANGGVYRSRTYRLGDIVNSKPVTVGQPAFQFYDTTNAGYAAFKARYATRKNVVYVGANDGMLHAFDGTVGNTSPVSGSELFAYIPSFVYGTSATAATSGLASLGNPNFVHHYMVDATPGEFDIDLNKTSGNTGAPDWRTLLIGGLGKGGRGYYALDVTDPTSWTDETAVAGKVMWEFTDPRMGYSYSTPSVVKTKKYGWVVIFTSGYTNADGQGYFFFVNPANGALLETVSTPSGAGSVATPLDMGPESAYVENYTDMTADAIYAGDLQGNIWRVDVSASNITLPYPTAVKIAMLKDGAGKAQPITTRPLIEIPASSKTRYLLVGTGKLLADSDIASGAQQTFYAIVDGISTSGAFYGSASQPLPAAATFPITRGQLTANPALLTGITSAPHSAMGWYFDLPIAGSGVNTIAQRVNVDPYANQGIVAFIGNLPNGSVCNPGGNGTLYGVNFATGQTVLLNSDLVTPSASTAISGVGTDVTILSVNGNLNLYTGGSKGVVAKDPAALTTAAGVVQVNWRDVPATN